MTKLELWRLKMEHHVQVMQDRATAWQKAADALRVALALEAGAPTPDDILADQRKAGEETPRG